MTDDITRLEARLQHLEDLAEITRLLASYGPLVDSGDADAVAALWTEDGTYDVEGWHMGDRSEIHAMVNSKAHQRFIASGSLHFMGPPAVRIDGDTAVAVCESLMVLHQDGAFTVARGGAQRIRLVRTADGWRTKDRYARTLDGSAEARAVLGSISSRP